MEHEILLLTAHTSESDADCHSLLQGVAYHHLGIVCSSRGVKKGAVGMSSANHIDQLTLILGTCLESLDALGFAAAAAYIDTAIKMLPKNRNSVESSPDNIMFYNFGDDKYFEELDNLVDEYFGEICIN